MVEYIGLISCFLLATESYNFAQIFHIYFEASKTKILILAFAPLLAASTACFNA